MKHKICKLSFSTDLHIGNGLLIDNGISLCADTFFSALCHEALKMNPLDGIEQLVQYGRERKIIFSDLFPYYNDILFLPKPMWTRTDIVFQNRQEYKVEKSLRYVNSQNISQYLQGELDYQREYDILKGIGKENLRIRASMNGIYETRPYYVGSFCFKKGAGLYVIIGYEEEEALAYVESLIAALSYTGIGGKISSGFGRFTYQIIDTSQDWDNQLMCEDAEKFMILNTSLPKSDELMQTLENAYYQVVKRSGFVSSGVNTNKRIGPEMRKNDLFVLQQGSCFRNRFEGDIYDVSNQERENSHPVYRYAIPMFWRIE